MKILKNKEFIPITEDKPTHLETVWLFNEKTEWIALGCLVKTEFGYYFAESNGVIYIENGRIVSECESDDLDVTHFCKLPKIF